MRVAARYGLASLLFLKSADIVGAGDIDRRAGGVACSAESEKHDGLGHIARGHRFAQRQCSNGLRIRLPAGESQPRETRDQLPAQRGRWSS